MDQERIALIAAISLIVLLVLYMEGHLDFLKAKLEGYTNVNGRCPPCPPCYGSNAVTVRVDDNAGYGGMRPFPQIGYLVRNGGTSAMQLPVRLPLYGQESRTRRGRFNYYVISDKLQLPVIYNKRNCSDEIACNELYDAEIVSIPDDGDAKYIVQIYDR